MKPILFNTKMVRAILDGRKTTTRRVIKPSCKLNFIGTDFAGNSKECRLIDIDEQQIIQSPKPPYQIGDILYVRETFCPYKKNDVIDGVGYAYKADATPDSERVRKELGYKWRPSIHMPKEAARIFLQVDSVRTERIQKMNGKDALDEGCNSLNEFIKVWNNTVKPSDLPLYGWDANPWVWVIQFSRINSGDVND